MRQIKEIQNRLNNADWTAEYCHPDKWLPWAHLNTDTGILVLGF